MTDKHKKGSPEEALNWWRQVAPDAEFTVAQLLTDIYNFQQVGATPMVTKSVLLQDGRVLRLYGGL